MTGALNTDLQYRGEGSRYGSFEAKDLGMERFGVAIEQGHYDGVRAKIGYSESPYYWSQNGLTAYSPGNPMVSSGSLDKFDKQVLRKKLSGGIAYTPKSPWRPYAEFSHEQKEGTLAFIQNNTQGVTGASFVPKPIDNSSTTLVKGCLLYTSPSPRDRQKSRMPSSA